MIRRKISLCVATSFLTVAAGCAAPTETNAPSQASASHSLVDAAGADVARYNVEIVDTHPFDATSFTQGLEVDGDRLLVSTGWNGESRVYHSSISGEQQHSQSIPAEQFGEGVTRVGDTVWQLTWKAGVAYKRDAETLEQQAEVTYPGEGWGLCSFPDVVVMSDGTDELRLIDPETFAERSRIPVTVGGSKAQSLNELDCTTDESGNRIVYSNVFLSTDIYRISLDTGDVTGIIDASTVPNRAAADSNNVLNGIASIPGTDRLYLTGKRWPDLYEVQFVPTR
ncbi:glutaminyl-peptide cyclotransferase [Corynebacterium mustelae]